MKSPHLHHPPLPWFHRPTVGGDGRAAQAPIDAAICSGLMAPVLAAYQRRHGLDESGLAAYLGCRLPTLHALALCPRPAGEGPAVAADVRRLAARLGCHTERLASVLREAPDP